MRAMWLLLMISAANAVEPTDEMRSTCKDRGGIVVEACVSALAEAADHTDDFMRQRSLDLGARALAKANAPYAAEDARRQADAERAKRFAECKKRGLVADEVKLGMSAADVRSCGWGATLDVRRLVDKDGTRERWVYPYGEGWRALILQNGRVKTIEERWQ